MRFHKRDAFSLGAGSDGAETTALLPGEKVHPEPDDGPVSSPSPPDPPCSHSWRATGRMARFSNGIQPDERGGTEDGLKDSGRERREWHARSAGRAFCRIY